YGDAIVIKKNDDGSVVVQLRVNDDLSDMELNMRVVVPGLYDTEHKAILVFGDMEQIETDGYHVYEQTPEKPELGNGNGNGENGENGSDPKESGLNPQTGDTTAILMYSLLLVAAATALFFQLRRRFAKE